MPATTCPPPSRSCGATHTAMLLALGAPPGNSRIPMGGGSEWPRAPRLEPVEPRPELPAAAARVRKPVVARGSIRPLQAGSRLRLPGAVSEQRRAPPPVTAGALARAIADAGAPESAPGSALRSHRVCGCGGPGARGPGGGARPDPSHLVCARLRFLSSETLEQRTCHGPGALVFTRESRTPPPPPHTLHTHPNIHHPKERCYSESRKQTNPAHTKLPIRQGGDC